MFTTLRSKLISSYSVVALLCLALAVVGTLAFASGYAQRSGFRTLEEKRALATPLLRFTLSNLNRPQVTGAKRFLGSIQEAIRSSALRVILVDPASLLVVEDTSTRYNAVGQRFNFDVEESRLSGEVGSPGGIMGVQQFTGEPDRIQFIAQRIRLLRASGTGAFTPAPGGATDTGPLSPYIIVYAQPEVRLLSGLLGDLRDALLPGIVIALLISLMVAYLLARSISRPITKLVGAAVAMSKGDYDQRLPVEGRDELGALTNQFNIMASEVSRAHKMQRDFVANVSHDLKTPLTSIQGFSQAILDGAIRDKRGYDQAANIINTEAQRMSRLVSELLNLTRLENGLSSLELRAVDVGQVISQLALAMQPQAEASEIRLTVRMGGPGSAVLADVDRLKQAFGNLIDNAIKHTPAGGMVTVEVSDVPNAVQVNVRDTGQGIPEEDLSRVMERFYQIDKARSSGSRSLGLGLAIAREIVNAHRGQISISSEVGVGTEVRVTLPADARISEPLPATKKWLGRTARHTTQNASTGVLTQPYNIGTTDEHSNGHAHAASNGHEPLV